MQKMGMTKDRERAQDWVDLMASSSKMVNQKVEDLAL